MPLEQKTILHIIELEGDDIMNILARSVLEFYTFDENPDGVSRENLMRQSIELISKFPTTIAYAFNMYAPCTSATPSRACRWRRISSICSRARTTRSWTPARWTCC